MDQTQIINEISRMLFGYPSCRTMDPEAYRVLLVEFTTAVDDGTAPHVAPVCRDVKLGRIGNPSFPPTVAEFAGWLRKARDDADHAEWQSRQRITREPEPKHDGAKAERIRAMADEAIRRMGGRREAGGPVSPVADDGSRVIAGATITADAWAAIPDRA